MVARHNKGIRIVSFKEGEVSLVRAANWKKRPKGARMFQYKATIVKVHQNNSTVRLRWIGQGPRESDKEGTEATFSVRNIKKFPLELEPSEEFGSLFEEPAQR